MPDLPLYPLPLGSCITLPWVEMRHQKMLGSRWRTRMMRDPEAGFYGMLLWFEAMRQDPAGTLPDDDDELAMLVGLGGDVERWRRLRGDAPDGGALYGWRPCQVGPPDGETEASGAMVVRLMHKTVTEVALVAWGHSRDSHRRREAATRARQIHRVKEMLKKTPCRSRLAKSTAFAGNLLDWLKARDLDIRLAHVLLAVEELQSETVVTGIDFGAS